MDPMTISALAGMATNASQAGVGLFNTIAGAIGAAKTKKQIRALEANRPKYQIKQPIFDNQNLAESRAQQGLSDRSLDIYRDQNARGLTASLNAMLAGGSAMDNVGDVYGNYENGVSKMALVDDQMQTVNVQNLMRQNEEMAGELDKEWQWNVQAPWVDKMNALTQDLAARQKQTQQGITSMLGAGANMATAGQYKKEGDNVFGDPNARTAPATTTPQQRASAAVANINGMMFPTTAPAPQQSNMTMQQRMKTMYPGLDWLSWNH